MRKRLKLRIAPDKALRTKCAPVLNFTDVKDVLNEMDAIMHRNGGVALAAPQVGILHRFFVITKGVLPTNVAINPSWERCKRAQLKLQPESCLSFPGLWKAVPRFDRIRVSFLDTDKQIHNLILEGFEAQIFQHEVDHLDGILFVDKKKESV